MVKYFSAPDLLSSLASSCSQPTGRVVARKPAYSRWWPSYCPQLEVTKEGMLRSMSRWWRLPSPLTKAKCSVATGRSI